MDDPHRAGQSNHKRILLFDRQKVCLIVECMLRTSVEQISNKMGGGKKKEKRKKTLLQYFVYNQKCAVAKTNSTVNIIQVCLLFTILCPFGTREFIRQKVDHEEQIVLWYWQHATNSITDDEREYYLKFAHHSTFIIPASS